MAFEVYDGVCDQLAGTVKGCLSAAERFVEGGLAQGGGGGEVGDLIFGEISYFAAAAGVDGMELGCDDGWVRGGDYFRRSFVSEEVRDEGLLESVGVVIVS